METYIKEAEEALSIAKIGLMEEEELVFFSAITVRLEHIFDDSIETAETNGLTIRYNPAFFMEQTKAARVGLLFHEVGHVVFRHPERLREHFLEVFGIDLNIEDLKEEMRARAIKIAQKYNQAADYVINILADKANLELPPGALLDYKYDYLSTEDVYRILPDDPEPPGGIGIDLSLPAPGTAVDDTASSEDIRAQIDDVLIQATIAAQVAGYPGSVPGEIGRHVEELLNPTVPWYRLMHLFARRLAKDSYSMRRPNRKFFPEFYLPSRYSEKVDRCAFMVDASGSVDDDDFNHMVSNTANFIKMIQPEVINFIQFDTRIKSNDVVKTLQDLREVQFHEKGGTNITEVMEWIIENKPVVSVIFTDGWFKWQEHLKPKTPIIWLIHDNPTWTAPIGKVIHVDYKD